MQYTILPDQMKALEARWMQETGVPGALLMEHAAQGVAAALGRYSEHGWALFLCGPGNNGGDGYAAARLWQMAGGHSVIWELTDRQRGDAAMNRLLAQQCGITIYTLTDELPPLPCVPDVICDALFGTGLSRPLEGMALKTAQYANAMHEQGTPIVAVDIPSGLDGTTGMPLGTAICATETVTFHRIKQGLVIGRSADHVGRLTVHSILIPADVPPAEGLHVLLPQKQLILDRRPGAHKGSFGKVVIFAGSFGMAGAAALCAKAAIRSGAGLTYILARTSIVPMLQVLVPGAVCVPLPECGGKLTEDVAAIVRDKLHGADAAAVGCGLGQSEDVMPVLRAFHEADCPVVWDADALNLLAAHRELLPLPKQAYITPHPGEAARLLGCSTGEVLADGLAALRRLHEVCGCHVLLKGARTLMTDGDLVGVNVIGSPAMAKGGSGDVLTGILAALIAGRSAGRTALETMQIAALAHGMAGVRAAKISGQHGTTPEQLCDHIRFDDEGMDE